MAAHDAYAAHIVERLRLDIDFLVAQNVISPADGLAMAERLPGRQAAAPAMPMPGMMPTPSAMPPAARRGAAPPPPPPAAAPQVRALWAYNGQDADDLAFAAGETVEVLEEANADWFRGRNARGETGLFPANYVERIAPAPAAGGGRMVAPAPASGEKGAYGAYGAPPPPPPQEQPQEAQPAKKGKFGKLGGTMAQSAAGGVGFGAGAAVGSGIIHAIF